MTQPTHTPPQDLPRTRQAAVRLSRPPGPFFSVVEKKTRVFNPLSLLPGTLEPVPKSLLESAVVPATLRVHGAQLLDLIGETGFARDGGELSAHLERCATTGSGLSFNAIGARKRCPRRYALAVPASVHSVLLSARDVDQWTLGGRASTRFRAGRPTACFLANIPRTIRPAISAPTGHLLIDLDIRSAHHAIAAAITGDASLQAAVDEGIHAATGRLLGAQLPPEAQYRLGKRCNSALLARCGPQGLLEQLNRSGTGFTLDLARARLEEWWGDFHRVDVLVRALFEWIESTRNSGLHLKFHDGERTLSYYSRDFLLGSSWEAHQDGRVYRGVPNRKRPNRSVWTGILRSIESVLMDQILVRAHELGLQLAMPMYDGALWVAPAGKAQLLAAKLTFQSEQVLREAGLGTGVVVDVRERWGVLGA